MATVTLKNYTRSKHQISMVYGVDDLQFTTSFWYNDVDFYLLENLYGERFMHWFYFNLVAFEMNKLQSVRPKYVDFGEYERFHTAEFERIWRRHFRGAYSQWLYQNDLDTYTGPEFVHAAADESKYDAVEIKTPTSAKTTANERAVLVLNGGGKDSLVSMSIFDKIGVDFASVGVSACRHGVSKKQHKLIRDLTAATNSKHHHQIWMFDDFFDSPLAEILGDKYGIKTVHVDEVLRFVMSMLPIVLQYGYRFISLGHEKSAEVPNFVWQKNGLAINHQHGKSRQQILMLKEYINENLIRNCHIFSVLKPINDVVIFSMLNSLNATEAALTHSCNLEKPWCKKCPKCAYVLLGFMAYLPRPIADDITGENVLNLPELRLFYRQLLGFDDFKPFECVGLIEETRLAFEICRRRGYTGKAMDDYSERVDALDFLTIADELTRVDCEYDQLPDEFREEILKFLNEHKTIARRYVEKYFQD
ncbi:UDP-N-acetyl-alpha-D-muramoyl-L-alanyl-L-glutamate epimerase-like [Tubulanus polymorphus]|uniref:UDP-N-acetyl-alpha-D-muramoyl-L-alanyl-L- glutamate epimerase-like n=1 Tax=Tubulanus polymorphus TaxID=672921 RepID=UPI003DA1F700